MSVYELLEQKGTLVYTISAEAGVDQCIQLLNEKNIGALLVTGRGGEVEGIVSERDILREVGRRKGKIWSLAVGEIMIPRAKMITAHPDDPIELIMERMTNHRIRHIPIMNGARAIGLVSIGDVVKLLLRETLEENREMRGALARDNYVV